MILASASPFNRDRPQAILALSVTSRWPKGEFLTVCLLLTTKII